MNWRDRITPLALRLLADELQDAAQEINDHLDGAGIPMREVADGRRKHVMPRLAAAGALRNAAAKLTLVLPIDIGER